LANSSGDPKIKNKSLLTLKWKATLGKIFKNFLVIRTVGNALLKLAIRYGKKICQT